MSGLFDIYDSEDEEQNEKVVEKVDDTKKQPEKETEPVKSIFADKSKPPVYPKSHLYHPYASSSYPLVNQAAANQYANNPDNYYQQEQPTFKINRYPQQATYGLDKDVDVDSIREVKQSDQLDDKPPPDRIAITGPLATYVPTVLSDFHAKKHQITWLAAKARDDMSNAYLREKQDAAKQARKQARRRYGYI